MVIQFLQRQYLLQCHLGKKRIDPTVEGFDLAFPFRVIRFRKRAISRNMSTYTTSITTAIYVRTIRYSDIAQQTEMDIGSTKAAGCCVNGVVTGSSVPEAATM